MASYQDLESRIAQLERMIRFTMKSFTVTRREGIIAPKIVTRTMLDLYYNAQGAGLQDIPVDIIEEPADAPPAPAEDTL